MNEYHPLTCPRCDLATFDGWCPICGDQYPWPKANEPAVDTPKVGIRTLLGLP